MRVSKLRKAISTMVRRPQAGWRRRKMSGWSIGVYAGSSLLTLGPPAVRSNPVLTAADVSDTSARFVADPFMVQHDQMWFMFFEVMPTGGKKGVIGLAQSEDAVNWHYREIVIDEPFHLSYPYVFSWSSQFYMIPETYQDCAVRLYRVTEFPVRWTYERNLLEGRAYIDASICRFDGRWWLFTSNRECDELRLFGAQGLMGEWSEHPRSPLIQGRRDAARPAGRIIESGESLIRFAQDDCKVYGRQVHAFAVDELTETDYAERRLGDGPVLKPAGSGWNAERMHHIDAHQLGDNRWIACVDGYGKPACA